MHKFGRGALVCSGAALLVTLTACSSGGTGSPAPEPTGSKQTSQAQSSVEISNPKDASAVPLCDLLPTETATSLGYKSQGKKQENMLDENIPPMCEWEHPEDSSAGVALSVLNRKISDYYAHPETWGYFKKLTVSGHPAAIANMDPDPMRTGACNIYLGTQQNQMISSQAWLRGSEVGKKDPCQVARKALEAAVPTLPQAK